MDAVRERVREILKRAGMSHVPLPAVIVVVLVALVAAAAGLWHWWPRGSGSTGFALSSSGSDVVGRDSGSTSSSGTWSAPSSQDASSAAGVGAAIYVHVVGAVRRPGLYSLPAGSRLADAIARAGGLLGNAEERAINLARQIQDGEQIVVLTQDEYLAPVPAIGSGGTSGAGAGAASAGAPIDINSADVALLDTLPGVGPSTAQKIVADREANGPFASVDDLARVTGIGAKKLDALRDLIVAR